MADLVPAGTPRVIDATAAPGGKTFRLLARGSAVMAVDRSELRLARVRESLVRLKMQADVRVHDWSHGPMPGVGEVEAVLVDAPCTALGVLRRHPEIRWRRSPMDPSAASVVQLQILHAASRHVKRGGALVYVVCSPEPEEGSEVVKAFLAESGAFRLDALRTTAPPEHDEDAFFGARLVRA
jgi:16S rRNA (cytosine967-C5)-methyltransferase